MIEVHAEVCKGVNLMIWGGRVGEGKGAQWEM